MLDRPQDVCKELYNVIKTPCRQAELVSELTNESHKSH